MKYLFRDRIPSGQLLTAFLKESSDTHPDHHDYHPHFELYFRRAPLPQGITLNGEVLHIDSPAVVLTAPFQIHAMSPATDCDRFERHVVYFNQGLIDAADAFLSRHFFTENANCLFSLTEAEACLLEDLLPTVFDSSLPDKERALAFVLLLARLDRLVAPTRRKRFGRINAYIPQVLQYLYDHATEELATEPIAAKFHVSRAKLNRDFRASVGQSLHGAVMDLRLSMAKALLREGMLSVGEIARQCGFSCEHYFYAFFKRSTGVTPLQYRRDHRLHEVF